MSMVGPKLSRVHSLAALALNKVCGGVFDGDAMMKSVLVCAQRMMNNV